MSTTEQTPAGFEELTRRESNGIAVALLWRRADDRVKVTVSDETTETRFEIDVADASPMDVFHHPYAYAAFRGIDAEPAAELAAV